MATLKRIKSLNLANYFDNKNGPKFYWEEELHIWKLSGTFVTIGKIMFFPKKVSMYSIVYTNLVLDQAYRYWIKLHTFMKEINIPNATLVGYSLKDILNPFMNEINIPNARLHPTSGLIITWINQNSWVGIPNISDRNILEK